MHVALQGFSSDSVGELVREEMQNVQRRKSGN